MRMGPPPRSFAAEAHGCFMVRIPGGPTEYKVAARCLAPKAGSPQTVVRKWLTCSTQRHSKSRRCQRKTLDLKRPVQVFGPVVEALVPAMHQHVQHHTCLVDRAPEPVLPPGDLYHHLIL